MNKIYLILALGFLTACASQPQYARAPLQLTNEQYLRLLQMNIDAANAYTAQMQQLNRSNENFVKFMESDPSKW